MYVTIITQAYIAKRDLASFAKLNPSYSLCACIRAWENREARDCKTFIILKNTKNHRRT